MTRLEQVIRKAVESFSLEEVEKWIQKIGLKKGALKKQFPGLAKGGFTSAELEKIIKKGGKGAQRARLAKTLKKFKKK